MVIIIKEKGIYRIAGIFKAKFSGIFIEFMDCGRIRYVYKGDLAWKRIQRA